MEVAQYLLDPGAEVDARDEETATRSDPAVREDLRELAALLLERGGNPNAQEDGGRKVEDVMWSREMWGLVRHAIREMRGPRSASGRNGLSSWGKEGVELSSKWLEMVFTMREESRLMTGSMGTMNSVKVPVEQAGYFFVQS